jgi:hypothetical protein
MLELYRFFLFPGSSIQFANLDTSREGVVKETSALLIGPQHRHEYVIVCQSLIEKSGKTSLLFQYAYFANENRSVVFLCSKRKMQYSLPLFLQDYTPDTNVLKKIKIK